MFDRKYNDTSMQTKFKLLCVDFVLYRVAQNKAYVRTSIQCPCNPNPESDSPHLTSQTHNLPLQNPITKCIINHLLDRSCRYRTYIFRVWEDFVVSELSLR